MALPHIVYPLEPHCEVASGLQFLNLIECITQLLLRVDQFDLQLGVLTAEHLQGLVLLLQLEIQLVSFEVEGRPVDLGLDQLLLQLVGSDDLLLELLLERIDVGISPHFLDCLCFLF